MCALEKLLGSTPPTRAVLDWLVDILPEARTKERVVLRLGDAIARVDQLIARQVDEIIHHPRFQKLEASWRGLKYLTKGASEEKGVKVKALNVSWRELARDAERALEFDQSELFRKVFTEEYDMPGGEPFGVLIGDYEIRLQPAPGQSTVDLEVLESISHVAAAAFAPFVAAAHPTFFGVDRFPQLDRLRKKDLTRTFQQREYTKWIRMRGLEDSRFVALTLPRVFLRLPYTYDVERDDGFAYREDVAGRDVGNYLWGNAAYAFGAVLIRTFSKYHWLAEIRGVRDGEEEGGVVTGLPVHSFATDRSGIAVKSSTDFSFSEHLDQEVADQGFIPLCHCKGTEFSAFYSNQSIEKPVAYEDAAATLNEKVSAMLQYMLCVARFAHTLKARMLQKIGTYTFALELERDLHNWLNEYVSPDASASAEVKAKYPLREAKVKVTELVERPGHFQCVLYLSPHYQLDSVSATVTLRTELRTTQR